jgi:hypothetical protein
MASFDTGLVATALLLPFLEPFSFASPLLAELLRDLQRKTHGRQIHENQDL